MSAATSAAPARLAPRRLDRARHSQAGLIDMSGAAWSLDAPGSAPYRDPTSDRHVPHCNQKQRPGHVPEALDPSPVAAARGGARTGADDRDRSAGDGGTSSATSGGQNAVTRPNTDHAHDDRPAATGTGANAKLERGANSFTEGEVRRRLEKAGLPRSQGPEEGRRRHLARQRDDGRQARQRRPRLQGQRRRPVAGPLARSAQSEPLGVLPCPRRPSRPCTTATTTLRQP